ncbi:hypothetical protein DPMN_182417 [Dreissena polymorpha]|uniref:Uncharacterized protein n=1 Tax=Dreissena polymorpha TaxID=45954 RepID=A0A9D4DFF2_DREPO|nr:hypothetical protein DPMN_182417 [Dreissena polymorpha]
MWGHLCSKDIYPGFLYGDLFGTPKDIDLFPGALSEKLVPGGALGPTMGCIIGDQFRRVKFGDRFFYQNQRTGFNEGMHTYVRNAFIRCTTINRSVLSEREKFL